MRGYRRTLRLLAACALTALFGCADAPPPSLQFLPRDGAEKTLVWPRPPEVPRFRYAGALTGEDNFVKEADVADGIVGALKWFVGLVVGTAPPTVLQRPQAGVVDEGGRILVTDASRQAVFVFDEKEGKLLVWDMAGSSKRFAAPVGIALGANGEILVSDAKLGVVVRLAHDGTPLATIGKGKLMRPTGLARDPVRGRIYVADTEAHDVKVFDDQGRLINLIGHSGDGEGELNGPTHLALAGGELYVTDSLNSRIQVYSTGGDLERTFGSRGLYIGNLVRPKGVAVDNEGHVYVMESYYGYMLVFDHGGKLLMSIGGTGKAHGQFYLPSGIWVDARNRVFVADMFNGRVEMFQFLGES